jgi:predicted metalloprotease with PDZ domain
VDARCYLIREFARHFVQVRAVWYDAGAITKTAKDCWHMPPRGSLTVTPRSPPTISVRTAHLDALRASSAARRSSCAPTVGRPALPSKWSPRSGIAGRAGGRDDVAARRRPGAASRQLATADYDELIDHPSMAELAFAS